MVAGFGGGEVIEVVIVVSGFGGGVVTTSSLVFLIAQKLQTTPARKIRNATPRSILTTLDIGSILSRKTYITSLYSNSSGF